MASPPSPPPADLLAAMRQRLADVHARIAAACRAAGRDPGTVRLLAVGKSHPPDALRALHALGVTDFGENYAQELATKAAALADIPVRFTFIGALQSNKIKSVVQAAAEIQTIADERYARLVAQAAAAAGKTPYPVWIAVNAAGEASKSGASPADVPALAALIQRELPELTLRGLMTIPPPLPEDHAPGVPPALYRDLAALARSVGAGGLSLGMSDDLAEAIAAGSTCVRIGTALLGPRAQRL